MRKKAVPEKINEISVKGLYKTFGNHTVLKDITVTCKEGTASGFVGHNGCGKSVLFKCICGFEIPEKGEVAVNGVVQKKGEILRNAGVIIEEPAFLRNENAYNNLDYLYRIRNAGNKEHLYSILRMVGLEPDEKKPVGKYSLGMKQRLAIAQAIMENPDVLILDEPMNGLDRKGIEEMRILFTELKRQGKILILASHNKEDIDILCDYVYELENGEMYSKK